MASRSSRAAAALGLVAMLLLPASAHADAQLRAAVEQLMRVGWAPSLQARDQAARLFNELPGSGIADPRAKFAFALVQVQQRQYPRAVELVSESLAREKENLDYWRVKLWLSMITRNTAAALSEMETIARLAGDAGADPPPAAAEAASRQELIRMLGRAMGYLEGPAAGQVAAGLLAETTRRVLEPLSEPQREAFDEGRRRVLDQFLAYAAEGERTMEEAIEAGERQKEELRERVETERARIEAELATVGPELEKVESERRSQVELISQKEMPLMTRLARLESQAAVVRREALIIASEIDRLRVLAARERDPLERERLLREADRLGILLARYEGELLGLDREARVVNAQRAELLRQRQQVEATYQRDVARLQARVDALRKQSARLGADERQLVKPVTGVTPRGRAIEREARAYTTYESLPMEQLRQRVLDALE